MVSLSLSLSLCVVVIAPVWFADMRPIFYTWVCRIAGRGRMWRLCREGKGKDGVT